MITIQELLYNRGLDKSAKVKIVRHKDRRLNVYDLYKTDRASFLAYQSSQGKDIFNEVEFIVSFVGEEGLLARFIGVYRIIARVVVADDHFKYQMEEVAGFEDLKERVVIKWTNAISWHQWIKNDMEVIEIHPGLHYQRFTDYFDFILSFEELKEIIRNEYADWKNVLTATKGVYLIHDSKTGKLYVGSAYGEDGIWGRWCNYVATNGHGGNKMLKALLDNDTFYGRNFHFSILLLLPKTVIPAEAIRKEQLLKRKFGTNAFGLNDN